jgi:DNA-binding MarR family transcriptional regulator
MKEPTTVAEQHLIFASNAIAREILSIADDAFQKHGLAYSHAFILIHVSKNPGVSIGVVAQIMMLQPSTLTRLCQKLEKNGLLKRQIAGRKTKINLTPKGEKLAPGLQKIWDNLTRNYTNLLGKEQCEKLTNRLYKSAKKLSFEKQHLTTTNI